MWTWTSCSSSSRATKLSGSHRCISAAPGARQRHRVARHCVSVRNSERKTGCLSLRGRGIN
eukprot:12390028-Prorocentrum_lima.AAC.1